jgi:hypothetical protein
MNPQTARQGSIIAVDIPGLTVQLLQQGIFGCTAPESGLSLPITRHSGGYLETLELSNALLNLPDFTCVNILNYSVNPTSGSLGNELSS